MSNHKHEGAIRQINQSNRTSNHIFVRVTTRFLTVLLAPKLQPRGHEQNMKHWTHIDKIGSIWRFRALQSTKNGAHACAPFSKYLRISVCLYQTKSASGLSFGFLVMSFTKEATNHDIENRNHQHAYKSGRDHATNDADTDCILSIGTRACGYSQG